MRAKSWRNRFIPVLWRRRFMRPREEVEAPTESVDPLDAMARPAARVWIVRRILLGISTLILISVLVFVATQALPGDAARAILGRNGSPTDLALLRQQLGLNGSLVAQYLHWVSGVIHGDLGQSVVSRETVSSMIGERALNSFILVALSAVIAIPTALVAGTYAAYRRDGAWDRVTTLITLILASIPEYIIAVALVILFATTVFHLLPAVTSVPVGSTPLSRPSQLVLPVAALCIAVVPYLTRITRASMKDVLDSEYVEMARLKGVRERNVVAIHALRNGLVPSIQVSALILGWLAGGIVVIEFVFNYPGLGKATLDAVARRDLPMVQALALLFAATYVVINLLADVLTTLASPRLRTKGT
jgi:peptide/nickel transport system permease protein